MPRHAYSRSFAAVSSARGGFDHRPPARGDHRNPPRPAQPPAVRDDLGEAAQILVDYANQPADLSFVIDRVLQQAHHRDSPLYRRVDARHLGVAGHSLGGVTVYGVVFNSCCRDRRIDAVVVMDGRTAPFGSHRFTFDDTPLLLIHLTGDPVVAFSYAFGSTS